MGKLGLEVLARIPNATPEFRVWFGNMVETPWRLNLILQSLVQTGEAVNTDEALLLLADFSKQNPLEAVPAVTLGDLKGDDIQGGLFVRLKQLVGREVGEGDPCRWYGTLSHSFLPQLFTGEAFFAPRFLEQDTQGTLFQTAEMPLFDFERPRKRRKNGKRLHDEDLEAIGCALDRIRPKLGAPADNRWVLGCKEEVHGLVSSMERPFGRFVSELRARPASEISLKVLTLASWAGAVQTVSPGNPAIFFSEVPVLESNCGFGAGRIDAIEVVSIRGGKPSGSQERILRQMSRFRYSSAGALQRELEGIFGDGVEVSEIDWKMAIGDGVGRRHLIQPEEVASRIPAHEDQMRRYLAMSSFGHQISSGKDPEKAWEKPVFTRGSLRYFLPTRNPIVHPVEMDPGDKERAFLEHVVQRWTPAQERAVVRRMNSLLVTKLVIPHLLHAERAQRFTSIENVAVQERKGNGVANRNGQTRLFSGKSVAVEVVEKYCYLDTHRILERVGTDEVGHVRARMDLRHLAEAIENGLVEVGRGWNWDRGGKIRCIVPGHADPGNPSLQIYLAEGHFYCYGCHARGEFDPASIPEGFRIDISGARRAGAKRNSASVPEEHHRVMRVAQTILSVFFPRSAGERYLLEERGIDPSVARSLGAGFGTLGALESLLDEVGYEELIRYGFLGISSNVREDHVVPRLFRKRGLTFEKMRCPVPSARRDAPEVFGLPWFALGDCVTFPLRFFDERKGTRCTNFYGRDTRPGSEFKHRKLSVAKTGILQGGFNIEVLDVGGPPVAYVTEAVIDALTGAMMGLPFVAMIGTGESELLRMIARRGREVVFVLDNDQPGRAATLRAADALKGMGFSGKVADGTPKLVPAKFKDLNEWWVKEGGTAVR